MLLVSRKSFFILVILAFLAIAGLAGLIWSGIYDVAADVSHSRPVYTLLETARERSIEVRASKLTVPDLTDKARIIQGVGNYNAMCMGCHLAPGMAETELSKGLYPAPPNLSKETVDAGKAFWVIKHGIKASGMPAWGKSMGDEYIWNMAAFLQALPKLTPEQYQALVASSGGHSHGGGESDGHAHAEGGEDHHDEVDAPAHAQGGDTTPWRACRWMSRSLTRILRARRRTPMCPRIRRRRPVKCTSMPTARSTSTTHRRLRRPSRPPPTRMPYQQWINVIAVAKTRILITDLKTSPPWMNVEK